MAFTRAFPLAVIALLFIGSCDRARDVGPPLESKYPVITPTVVHSESQLDPPTDVVRIELGELFGKNDVALFANGKPVFSGVITTAPDGVAHTMTLPWPAPRIALVVVIDGKGWQCDADLSRGRCLQVDYRQGQVKVLQTVHGLPHT